MLWLDSVVARQADDVHCRLTLRDSHVFVIAGEIESVVSIEWMAQAVAALVGLSDHERAEEPRPGYLIAVPQARFMVPTFRVGDVLEVRAHRAWGDDTLASFEAEVERDGAIAATAQLSVYRRKVAEAAGSSSP
jgi:predicted hotdog family 3-hydroxylacyl-ACP dehydratase